MEHCAQQACLRLLLLMFEREVWVISERSHSRCQSEGRGWEQNMMLESGKQPHRECCKETQNASFTIEDTCSTPTVRTCPNPTCLTLINLNSGFKIGVTISWDLFWAHHINPVVKNAGRPPQVAQNRRSRCVHTCITDSITTRMRNVTRKKFQAPQGWCVQQSRPSEPPSPTCRASTPNSAG